MIRRWPALVLGIVVGIVLSLATTEYVWPALAGDDLEPGELVILSGRDESAGGQRQALLEQWNDLHEDSPARISELPSSADEAHSQMVGQAQSDGEQVDIYNLDVTWTAEFAEFGYITPLENADTSGFMTKPLRTCMYDDQLWALPFNTDAGLLYYRSDLVSEALPETWDGVAQETKRVRATPAGKDIRTGLATQLKDYEGLTVAAIEAVLAEGGEVVDKNGEVVMGSDEAQAGLSRLAEAVGDPEVNLRASLDHDETDSIHAFRDGHALFMRNWPVAYRTLNRTDAPAAAPGKFSVAPLPGHSVLGGQNLAVATKSERPKAARKLIEFLTDPRSQQLLFERGGLAATREIVYLDPEVTREYPYAKILLSAIENAHLRPVTPYYTQFSQRLRAVVRALLLDGKLPPDYEDQLALALDGR